MTRTQEERAGPDGAQTDGARPEEVRTDVVVAALTAALSAFGTWIELTYSQVPVPPAAGAYALAVAAGAVLLVRRRWPVPTAVAALVLVYAYHLLGYPGEAPGVVLFVALYSVTAHGRGLRALATGLGLAVAAEFVSVVPPNPAPWYSPAVLAPSVSMGGAVLIGAVVRQRRLALEARLAREAEAAEGRLRERMAAERLAIARELHDVLAHTLSVIAVQAGAALDAFDDDPEQARRSLTAVRTAARDVLPGLHEALRALRGGDDMGGDDMGGDGGADVGGPVDAGPVRESAAVPAPQPQLAQLADVAARARAAGLDVDLELPPAPDRLPPLLQVTAYWIVTEALSNVMKHSNATAVRAAVTVEGTAVEGDAVEGTAVEGEPVGGETLTIVVEDNGHGSQAGGPAGGSASGGSRGGSGAGPGAGPGGFGLLGMAERAQLAGGTATAGPGPAGGFVVRASLPLGEP